MGKENNYVWIGNIYIGENKMCFSGNVGTQNPIPFMKLLKNKQNIWWVLKILNCILWNYGKMKFRYGSQVKKVIPKVSKNSK